MFFQFLFILVFSGTLAFALMEEVEWFVLEDYTH